MTTGAQPDEEDVVTRAAEEDVVTVAAEEHVVAVAAGEGEQCCGGGQQGGVDHVGAAQCVDGQPVVGRLGAGHRDPGGETGGVQPLPEGRVARRRLAPHPPIR